MTYQFSRTQNVLDRCTCFNPYRIIIINKVHGDILLFNDDVSVVENAKKLKSKTQHTLINKYNIILFYNCIMITVASLRVFLIVN